MSKQNKNIYVFLVAFIAAVGGFLFGYDLAIMAGVNIFLREQFNLSNAAFGFTQVSAVLGCIVGPFLGGWFCDLAGRKKTLIIASLLLAISAIITAVAPDIVTLNIFRFIGGIGVGLCSVCSPMYIAEIAPARIRGALGMMYQLAIVVGSVISGMTAYFLANFLPENISWRWMFASEMAAILVFVIFVLFLPRSPRWLAEKKRYDEALQVLTKINGLSNGKEEMKQIKTSLSQELPCLFSEFLKPKILKVLSIGILLAFFNTWTGWTGMSGFIPYLFQKAGVSDKAEAILQFILAYGFMLIVTTIACFLIDRFGRKPLWIFSSTLMIIAMALLGFVFQLDMRGFFILLIIFLSAIPHSLALGPMPWLMMSEIFPTRLRAKAVSITTTFLWINIFFAGLIFPVITGYSEQLFGSVAGIFWLFAVINICALFFGIKLLPETKGKTLEEITESLTVNQV